MRNNICLLLLLLGALVLFFTSTNAATCEGSECTVDDVTTPYSEIRESIVGKVGTLTTVAGKKVDGKQDGPGDKARFSHPTGLVTRDGYLYIADSENSKIRKMNIETGEVTTFAGSGEPGCRDGVGSEAQFTLPNVLLFDLNGNLLVGTYSQVRRISPEGVVTTFAGRCKTRDLTGTSKNAGFWKISGMDIDPATGIVYVSDGLNHKIKRITPEGKVSTLAGSMFGFKEGRGTEANLYHPSGLVFRQGVLFVADSLNHRIRRVTLDGVVSTFAGNGEKESKDGRSRVASFYHPVDVDIEEDGSMLVVDGWGNKLRRITKGVVSTIEWDDNGKTTSEITAPTSLTIYKPNEVYFVTDSHSIKKLEV